MVAHADPEEGAIGEDPIAERGGEVEAVKAVHAVAESPLAGENEVGEVFELGGFGDEGGGVSKRAAGVDHAVEVAATVVDHAEVHRFLEDFFGGGDAVAARVAFGRLAESDGERFEDRFGDVVAVASVEDLEVEVAAEVGGEGAAELFDEGEGEVLRVGGGGGGEEFEVGAVAEVDDAAGEGFIHGEVGVTVSADPGFVAEGGFEAFAEDDPGVFDGVVEVDLEVAIDLEVEVDQRVAGKEGEHVVEKGDAGVDEGVALAVEVKIEADLGLGSLAAEGGGAWVIHGGRAWLKMG